MTKLSERATYLMGLEYFEKEMTLFDVVVLIGAAGALSNPSIDGERDGADKAILVGERFAKAFFDSIDARD